MSNNIHIFAEKVIAEKLFDLKTDFSVLNFYIAKAKKQKELSNKLCNVLYRKIKLT